MIKALGYLLLGTLFSIAVDAKPPLWALDPQKEGYLTGVGVAKLKPNKKNAEMFRDRAAKLMAEAELAKQISIHVKSVSKSSRNSDGSQSISIDSIQTSITTLNTNKAEVLNQWVDPATGTLYLMLGLPIGEEKRSAVDSNEVSSPSISDLTS